MTTNVVDGDLVVRGALVATTLTPSGGSVTSTSIAAAANLDADKLEHRHWPSVSQPNITATTETKTIFVARKTGVVNEVRAGSIAIAVGAATVTVDVKKNGTTILTGVLTLNSANTARVTVAATISGSLGQYVAGDWFEVVLVATAGGGTLQTGVFVQLECDTLGV